MICFRTPLLSFLRLNYMPLIHHSLRILDSEGSARARRGQRLSEARAAPERGEGNARARPSEARRRRQAEPTPFTHDSFRALIDIGIVRLLCLVSIPTLLFMIDKTVNSYFVQLD